jgi:solute carrier family 39 (zinc transporter), member 9
MTMSQSKLRLISTIGMGLLVGTSLIVIIPEGIETLYSSGRPSHAVRREVKSRSLDIRWLGAHRAAGPNWKISRDVSGAETLEIQDRGDASKAATTDKPPLADKNSTDPAAGKQPSPQDPEDSHGNDGDTKSHDKGDHDHRDEPSSPHAYVGLSLILGFILMYLIDQLPQHASSNSRNHHQPYHISLDNLSQGIRGSFTPNTRGTGADDGLLDQPYPLELSKSRSLATTTGLVIHAAADGIALGASSSATSLSLGFIIFLAIMIHKAPAAFGLTSVLLKQGLSKRQARGHLVIFSLAAPAGALVTWMLISILGRGRMGGEEGTKWWTGVLLLFSAGTFL